MLLHPPTIREVKYPRELATLGRHHITESAVLRNTDRCVSYPPPHSRAILRGDSRWGRAGSRESVPGCEGVGKVRAGESGFVS